MLHCLNTSGNLTGNCSDMTVLERQRHKIRWQQQQQQQQPELQNQSHGPYGGAFVNEFSGVGFGMESIGGSALGEVVAKSSSTAVKPDPVFEIAWPDLVSIRMPGAGFGSSRRFDANSAVSTNSTTAVTEAVSAKEKTSWSSGKESFKKRKSDKVHKVVAENENKKEKKLKGSVEEGDSKLVTEQNNNQNRNNNNTCGGTSKDNTKASEAQKSDYIHVRARRGQATDSHSLAERVRREKISERMKYLQDLVPGCNKITGKAGMLDEIINYVQSLQRQVEFLSMKLAAVNPRLDFNLNDLFSKEAFGACGPSFATMGIGSDMNNQASYVQLNSAQQQMLSSCCGLDIDTDMALLRRSFSAPLSIPQTFLESSCFTQILPSTWESDFHNLSNVAFDQARQPTSFTSQPFTGLIEGSNPKMEI